MSVLEKIISRKKPEFQKMEIPVLDTVTENPKSENPPPENSKSKIPDSKFPSPCKICDLPVFWQSVYVTDPGNLDDLRCPECDPAPSPSLIGRRLMLTGTPSRLVEVDERLQVIDELTDQGPGGESRHLDDSATESFASFASRVELRLLREQPPLVIWSANPKKFQDRKIAAEDLAMMLSFEI
jgi:hypothetical protein